MGCFFCKSRPICVSCTEHSHKVPGSNGSRNGVEGRGSRLCKIVVRGGYTPLEQEPEIWYVNPWLMGR